MFGGKNPPSPGLREGLEKLNPASLKAMVTDCKYKKNRLVMLSSDNLDLESCKSRPTSSSGHLDILIS